MLSNEEEKSTPIEKPEKPEKELYYVNRYNTNQKLESDNINTLDQLLEKEKINSKSDPWNKIDKTTKIQLLHSYAERYGVENKIPAKDIKNLKTFFTESLNKGKLSKNKDISYIKETQTVSSIPSLFFNSDKRAFTLRIVDNKRVSTMKSLTPKKNK
tara:strand:+ start:66 stop:536 length:471 start_codon:yes stop_codon:yes gene_type:complete